MGKCLEVTLPGVDGRFRSVGICLGRFYEL